MNAKSVRGLLIFSYHDKPVENRKVNEETIKNFKNSPNVPLLHSYSNTLDGSKKHFSFKII